VQGHPWLWDDDSHIADNHAVTRGVALADYFLDANTTTSRPDYNHEIYRPLRNLTWRATARLFGVEPAPFEAVSLGLYALLAAMLFLALSALIGDGFAAAAATIVWVLLPVHVQAVAYPSAMGDLLSAVVELAALAAGLCAARRGSAAWAAASMFAKEIAVTEPLLLALLLWLDQRRPRWLLLVVPHFLAALGYVVMRSLVLGRVAQRGLSGTTVALGVKKAPILLAEYARLTLAPLGHSAFYSVPVGVGRLLLALLALFAVAVVAWSVHRRAFFAGVVAFGVALLPVLQLLPITTDLADRFALFASLGVALAAASALAIMPRKLALLCTAAAALLYLGGTLVEQRMWLSDGALWRYSVDREPEMGVSHANLGNVLLKEGRPAEALAELDRARALGFDYPFTWLRRARALDELGRTDEAIAPLRAALRQTPGEGQLHALLGDLYRRAGRLDEARSELGEAERLAPSAPLTHKLRESLR
jgi:protein O-mannosyl-transferase